MDNHKEIPITNYLYDLPASAIARYPLDERDSSRLLVYKGSGIQHRNFSDLPGLLPEGSWLVFNNTRVIQARLVFHKPSGARIEIFCLEPSDPAEYSLAFESHSACTWTCLVGNARKWKSGAVNLKASIRGKVVEVKATLEEKGRDHSLVRFQWAASEFSFAEIVEHAGSTPIPPYLNRQAEDEDKERYQTVYSRQNGSVAAPTAGLHFSDRILRELDKSGFPRKELTLHVGAGTFVPVKHTNARVHPMHAETVIVDPSFLEYWLEHTGGLVAVGTTSTRSLETLYWLGVKALQGMGEDPSFQSFRQWDNEHLPQDIPLEESLIALLDLIRRKGWDTLHFSTSLMIIPGYRFRALQGLITNFHMPGSTLLLLIAALIGEDWKKVYGEALAENYRFLSYGDSSLLLP